MNTKVICFSDLDGTYIDSNKAVRNAQAKSLHRLLQTPPNESYGIIKSLGVSDEEAGSITDKISQSNNISVEEAYQLIEERGLKNAIEEYLPLDVFFKGFYTTFDPEVAAQQGMMSVFPDALRFTRGGVPTVIISNSSQEATEKKLLVLGIRDEFVGVHADFRKGFAKPAIYLAEQAVSNLETKGLYSPDNRIIHVGDQEYDVVFGNNIKEIHKNTVNVLIDRQGGGYKRISDNVKPNIDYVVRSFDELQGI